MSLHSDSSAWWSLRTTELRGHFSQIAKLESGRVRPDQPLILDFSVHGKSLCLNHSFEMAHWPNNQNFLQCPQQACSPLALCLPAKAWWGWHIWVSTHHRHCSSLCFWDSPASVSTSPFWSYFGRISEELSPSRQPMSHIAFSFTQTANYAADVSSPETGEGNSSSTMSWYNGEFYLTQHTLPLPLSTLLSTLVSVSWWPDIRTDFAN